VTVSDVPRTVEISVAAMRTLPTTEQGLRSAVTAGDVPAGVTPLAGVPGINPDHAAALRRGLVLQEALQLGEAPGVQSPFGFPTPGFDAATEVGEVLDNDDRAGRNPVHDAPGENVVAIPSEPQIAAREASQVPLGTLRAVGLQLPFATQPALDDLAPVLLTEELPVRGDGGVSNAQIDAEGSAGCHREHVEQVA
jgi:hypothetical protein